MMNRFLKWKGKTKVQESKITVTGNTKNLPGHAAVVTDSTQVFLVEGMPEWDSVWLNKSVKVIGDQVSNGEKKLNVHHQVGSDNSETVIRAAVIMLLSESQ